MVIHKIATEPKFQVMGMSPSTPKSISPDWVTDT
jgi:hypothetical protein